MPKQIQLLLIINDITVNLSVYSPNDHYSATDLKKEYGAYDESSKSISWRD